jgi:glycosyltransferase involved in cell wall biosynthesis
MIEDIFKCSRTSGNSYQFSVLIPSRNSLGFLRTCIDSLRRNSYYDPQVIVIINEGRDGTKEWIECRDEIDYVFSPGNLGISYGLNIARSLIKSDYVICLDDHMYVLPGWDRELYREIERTGTKNFLLAGTSISPSGNTERGDYGSDFKSFDEKKLLKEYKEFISGNTEGCTSPPMAFHIDIWDLVGGMSIELSPGISAYVDFAGKLSRAGVKKIATIGSCLVYNFSREQDKPVEVVAASGNAGSLEKIISKFRSK